MNGKRRIRMIVDMAMTVLLPVIMAQLITGTELHEWFGTAFIVLLILHLFLNRKWFSGLFKGKYDAARIAGTIINILLIITMLLTAVSGIVLSHYVFKALPAFVPGRLARRLHMCAPWWGFILMSLHLGMHLRVMLSAMHMNKKQKLKGSESGFIKSIRIIPPVILVGLGAVSFARFKIQDYLLMNTEFSYYIDAEKPVIYFIEMVVMIAGFAAIGFYLVTIQHPGKS